MQIAFLNDIVAHYGEWIIGLVLCLAAIVLVAIFSFITMQRRANAVRRAEDKERLPDTEALREGQTPRS